MKSTTDAASVCRPHFKPTWSDGPYKELVLALGILGLWVVSLWLGLQMDLAQVPLWSLGAMVLLRIFLQTGLFITAHDAMHGSVCPANRKLNDCIGAVAVIAYAFLSYRKLVAKHRLHHRAPASAQDPDFHGADGASALVWYLNFMKDYLKDIPESLFMVVGMNLTFYTLLLGFHIPLLNLLLFWGLPTVLSTVQLFYFGTYLPHRELPQGYTDRHRATTSNFPVFWSLVSCYHFGYHWEHHEYPHLPWHRLPLARKQRVS
ncbi:fatty acid desaturase [Anthocerotibacter panamensis]|uniref:fatty acid desaturase n=1 Tax=Anthocerotibacter panamensis TaxID=2857077 RepID=UPI001C4032C1|nr:fatty acid desaturase [Anthocerotibacter panamensis]